MKLLKIFVKGNTRLLLNNINEITITPENMVQLILGSNGSGKSSILHIASPLPGVKADYIVGGREEIEVSKEGCNYKLISDFSKGQKHYFIKDGVYLGSGEGGNTLAVQTELVWQHFNINKEIHELMIGAINFTNLSPIHRRQWIIKVSNVDYSYVLGVHKKIKESHRDALGAFKHTSGKLTQEINNLLSIGSLEDITKEYNELNEAVTSLMSYPISTTESPEVIKDKLSIELKNIDRLSTSILNLQPKLSSNGNVKFVDELIDEINQLGMDKSVQLALRDKDVNEQNELLSQVSGAGIDMAIDVDELKGTLKERLSEQSTLTKSIIKWNCLIIAVDKVSYEFNNIKSDLIELIGSMEDRTDLTYSEDTYASTKEHKLNLTKRFNRLTNSITIVNNRVDTLVALKPIVCPKCSEKWTPGKKIGEVEELIAKLTILDAELSACVKELKVTEHKLEDIVSYKQAIVKFRNLKDNSSSLNIFWKECISEQWIKSPQLFMNNLTVLGKDIDNLIRLDRLNKTIANIEEVIINVTDKEVITINHKLKLLESNIYEYGIKVNELTKNINTLIETKNNLVKISELNLSLIEAISKFNSLIDTLIKVSEDSSVRQGISKLQGMLAIAKEKYVNKSTIEELISTLTKEKEELEKRRIALKLIESALSPTEGVVAQQMKLFLNNVVSNVNSVISSIWTYELKVLVCGLDKQGLDYKFPVVISKDGNSNTIPDISKGSEAQVDIINFAFKKVFMDYLGFNEYPLYLDEFGSSFDELHRERALSYIKQLVEDGDHAQLFMVSHYASQFGSFMSTDTLVLDESNITTTGAYNTHVVIK